LGIRLHIGAHNSRADVTLHVALEGSMRRALDAAVVEM
jgi:hypothetical protein